MLSAGRVLIKPEGEYSPLKTYEMLDYVSYNGSSYIAKKTTTGNLPTNTEYWQLSASGAQSQNVASNFAEVEGSDIASSPHAINDVFVNKDGKLLKATLAISIGDTIVIDTNCEPTTVEDLISYLSTQVSNLDSSNKKLNGITEIAVQTDLHTLGLGEFYKDKTSFYVTNGPEEVDEVASAIFRLTVESALDGGLSTTRLLTLKTPGGKVYTQNYDGSSWGDWEQVAFGSDVELKQNITDNALQTDSKTVPGAINELFSKSQTVKEEVNDIVNIYGAKNLLPNNAVSKTEGGVTFTVNSDGSITANGTATADVYLNIPYHNFKAGRYIVNGCPNGGGGSGPYVLFVQKQTAPYVVAQDIGNGVTFTLSQDMSLQVRCKIWSGQTVSNLTFYPMIRLASITDDTYVPYSMTNKQLTDCIAKIYQFSASFDGEKTVRDVLNELETMIENYITNNRSRLLVLLNIRSFALDMNCPVAITSNNIPGGFAFGGVTYMSNGANKIHAGNIKTSNSQLKYSIGDVVTDLTLTKPTSGDIRARCIIF